MAARRNTRSGAQAGPMNPLDAALAQVEKQFGKGSITRLGDRARVEHDVIPSGSLGLDLALGVLGLPRGRIVEAWGAEGAGKTAISLGFAAQCQRMGGTVAFIDAEHALDPAWAAKLGVDTDALLVSQPDNGEQALEIADILVRSGGVDLVVIDSVAALVPRAEIEGEMGDSHVGLQARLMSQALRKLTGAAAQSGTTIFFINQIREKIGVFFGSPETTTGGKALKFYASIRMRVAKVETQKDSKGNPVGHKLRVEVKKNKVAPPFKKAEIFISYDEGFVPTLELVNMGVEDGIIRKAGSWFSLGDQQMGQGLAGARRYLDENPEAAALVRSKILEARGFSDPNSGGEAPDAPADTGPVLDPDEDAGF